MNPRPLTKSLDFKKSGGRCAVSAGVSESRDQRQGSRDEGHFRFLAPWNAKLIPPGSAIGGPAVLGLTGDGRAALFSYSHHAVDPRGYVDHISLESQATGIDTPAALLGVWERINNPHWNSPEFKGNSSLLPSRY